MAPHISQILLLSHNRKTYKEFIWAHSSRGLEAIFIMVVSLATGKQSGMVLEQ